MTIIDLVPHMDAGDRNAWQGDQNERPLVDFGWEQARAQADALAGEPGGEPIDALYSGPSLRARQTLEPLAENLGLEIEILDGIGDGETWHVPDGWEPKNNRGANVAPHAAGMAMSALWDIQLAHPDGRVVACSHGHVIPALISFLIAAHDLEDVPDSEGRGQWYRIRLDGADVISVELLEAAEFPS